MNSLILSLLLAVSSLLANPKVQANASLLAQAKAMSSAATALVAEYNAQSTSSSNYQLLGVATAQDLQNNNFTNPTTTASGTPILYVGEDSSSKVVDTCLINASVSAVHNVENPAGVLNTATIVNWTLGGLPSSTTGILTPIDTSFGNFTTNVSLGNNIAWSYFPGGIKAKFGDATCYTYFPDESANSFGTPSTTLYSSSNPL